VRPDAEWNHNQALAGDIQPYIDLELPATVGSGGRLLTMEPLVISGQCGRMEFAELGVGPADQLRSRSYKRPRLGKDARRIASHRCVMSRTLPNRTGHSSKKEATSLAGLPGCGWLVAERAGCLFGIICNRKRGNSRFRCVMANPSRHQGVPRVLSPSSAELVRQASRVLLQYDCPEVVEWISWPCTEDRWAKLALSRPHRYVRLWHSGTGAHAGYFLGV